MPSLKEIVNLRQNTGQAATWCLHFASLQLLIHHFDMIIVACYGLHITLKNLSHWKLPIFLKSYNFPSMLSRFASAVAFSIGSAVPTDTHRPTCWLHPTNSRSKIVISTGKQWKIAKCVRFSARIFPQKSFNRVLNWSVTIESFATRIYSQTLSFVLETLFVGVSECFYMFSWSVSGNLTKM